MIPNSVDSLIEITHIAWSLLFLFWLIAAFTSKKTVKRESGMGRLLYIAVGVLAGYLLFSERAPIEDLNRPIFFQQVWWKYAGFIICISGLLFAVWARITLGTNWSGTVTVKEDHQLVMNGPYAISRNPIYTGIITALFGSACLSGEWHGYLGVVIMFLAFHLKIIREEKFMQETFGDQYLGYSRRVKRLIPFIY